MANLSHVATYAEAHRALHTTRRPQGWASSGVPPRALCPPPLPVPAPAQPSQARGAIPSPFPGSGHLVAGCGSAFCSVHSMCVCLVGRGFVLPRVLVFHPWKGRRNKSIGISRGDRDGEECGVDCCLLFFVSVYYVPQGYFYAFFLYCISYFGMTWCYI